MVIACLQSEIDTVKVSHHSKSCISKFTLVYGCLFMWGAYFFYMSAYERDVVVVIKMGAYFMGCLFSMGAYYPDFLPA